MSNFILENPGTSILAVDAGGTTGIALWDAWDGAMYVDHIDAGRGRKVRHRVHAGVVESVHRRDVERLLAPRMGVRDQRVQAGRGLGKGRMGNIETTCMVEHGVVTLLVDLVMAMGPRGFVVIEDFILGATGNPSGGRDGLSSVRIGHRLWDRLWERGCVSGDAWRMWQDHGWAGQDRRGWKVRDGVVPPFRQRLTAVERWRLGEVEDSDDDGVVWGGVGCHVTWQLPSERSFLKNVAQMDDWLKDHGMWVPGQRHAMDALEHVCVFARKVGFEIRAVPEKLWESGAKTDGKRVTAKSTKPPHPSRRVH